jgi:hypothetical protein
MADVAAIARELKHLARVIAVTERTAKDADDAFPWELSLQGLYARRAELLQELQGPLHTSGEVVAEREAP